jgi:lipoprotein-releasing system permease protein
VVHLELELALRFLRRRTGVLLRGTSLAALAGVTLAVMALVITLSLMNGYERAIASALQRGNAHMVGFAIGSMSPDRAEVLAKQFVGVDGVQRATPVSYLSGLLDDPQRPTNPVPVTLKAIARPPAYTGLEQWPDDGRLVAVVGERLASSTGLGAGDTPTVALPPAGRSWILPRLRLEIVGTFRLAFSEFDEQWVVVPLPALLEQLPTEGVAGIEIELEDPLAVEAARQRLSDLESGLAFTDWREMNSAMFAAIRWQTLSLFVVLTLVVAVASFQVSSALVVLSIDKQRSAGMLQALGATPARIRRILVIAGTLLGGAGVIGGLVSGCVVSWALTVTRAVRFPTGLARVYMVDSIPLIPSPLHLAAVAGVCLVLVFVASLWPAIKTSRMDPVAALRAA